MGKFISPIGISYDKKNIKKIILEIMILKLKFENLSGIIMHFPSKKSNTSLKNLDFPLKKIYSLKEREIFLLFYKIRKENKKS